MCPEALVSITMALVYLPVFYKLQITSSYEVIVYVFHMKRGLFLTLSNVLSLLKYNILESSCV
jgi:hypothetical protein